MAALVFDAGALIALDRGDRTVGALLQVAAQDGVEAITSSVCIAQVWRDPARQVKLTRAIDSFLEWPLDASRARRCGLLLSSSATTDITDAATVNLVLDGDTILTSDPADIKHLLKAAGINARVIPV